MPPKSGWHLPWNGSVDPDLEIIEARAAPARAASGDPVARGLEGGCYSLHMEPDRSL